LTRAEPDHTLQKKQHLKDAENATGKNGWDNLECPGVWKKIPQMTSKEKKVKEDLQVRYYFVIVKTSG